MHSVTNEPVEDSVSAVRDYLDALGGGEKSERRSTR
jgi:hypothetical protein